MNIDATDSTTEETAEGSEETTPPADTSSEDTATPTEENDTLTEGTAMDTIIEEEPAAETIGDGDNGVTGPPSEPKALAPPPSAEWEDRVKTLSSVVESLLKEKESHRVRVETQFQELKQKLTQEWDSIQQQYDQRLGSVQQELLKAQGVYEFLRQQEDAA